MKISPSNFAYVLATLKDELGAIRGWMNVETNMDIREGMHISEDKLEKSIEALEFGE